MRRSRFFKHMPTLQSIQENRFLKPFSGYLQHHFLWQLQALHRWRKRRLRQF